MPVNSFENYPLAWKPDRSKMAKPIYKYLADDLEESIRGGLIAPGTKLPPQREIADYLDLNLSTVTKAYDICRRKGLLTGVIGKGTYVADRLPGQSTLPIAESSSDIIDLSALSNFSENNRDAYKALQKIAADRRMPEMFDYGHPMGMPHQLQAGVRWMELIGVRTDIEHTAIVSGGQNGLMVSLLALFSPGDAIAVDEYTYASFIEMSKLFHIRLIPVAADEEGMLPEALKQAILEHRIKGIYLMPSCTNPTTIVMPKNRREAIAEVIREHRLILVEDDIASWLLAASGRTEESLFNLLPERCIYICGMSKSLCPGVRVAFLTYREDLKEAVNNAIFNLNVKTSTLDAEIITELLTGGSARRLIREKRKACQSANAVYEDVFGKESGKKTGNGGEFFFRWLPVPAGMSGARMERELLALGVRVFHSDRFLAGTKKEEAFIRISLGSAGNLKSLRRALCTVREYRDELENRK